MNRLAACCLCFFSATSARAAEPPASVCFGTPENGRLENGWKLPDRGDNFSSYSKVGPLLGRTYVHSAVHRTTMDAYGALFAARPKTVYVVGETGKREGGEFRPHETHRNGLSVDFMVPVLDQNGASVPLPMSVFNKYGYGIEFSEAGVFENIRIDFEALADHLLALNAAAKAGGIGIRRVIFDSELQKPLFKTPKGARLRKELVFSTFKPWVRHDEHYHVDFAVDCR